MCKRIAAECCPQLLSPIPFCAFCFLRPSDDAFARPISPFLSTSSVTTTHTPHEDHRRLPSVYSTASTHPPSITCKPNPNLLASTACLRRGVSRQSVPTPRRPELPYSKNLHLYHTPRTPFATPPPCLLSTPLPRACSPSVIRPHNLITPPTPVHSTHPIFQPFQARYRSGTRPPSAIHPMETRIPPLSRKPTPHSPRTHTVEPPRDRADRFQFPRFPARLPRQQPARARKTAARRRRRVSALAPTSRPPILVCAPPLASLLATLFSCAAPCRPTGGRPVNMRPFSRCPVSRDCRSGLRRLACSR